MHTRYLHNLVIALAIVAGLIIAWPRDTAPDFRHATTDSIPSRHTQDTTSGFHTSNPVIPETPRTRVNPTTARTASDSTRPASSSRSLPTRADPEVSALLVDSIELAPDGTLQPTATTRELLEQAILQVDTADDVEIIAQSIRETAGNTHGEQIAALFRDYARYKPEETEYLDGTIYDLAEESGSLAMLEWKLDELSRMRRQHFGDTVAEKLFGIEEKFNRHHIEYQKLMQTPGLDDEQRRQRLEELGELLPEEYLQSGPGDDTDAP